MAIEQAIAQINSAIPNAPSITNVVDAWPTWSQVIHTLTFRSGFNTNVVLTGTTLLGIAAGVIGVFTLLRKRALMSDAISHATLPGIGLAFILANWMGVDGRTLPVLLLGGTVFGALGVFAIQWLLRNSRLHEDASIGIVLSVFFGAGIVLLSIIQSMRTGNAAGLNKFIYGQTAAMSVTDAVLMGGIAVLAILSTLLLLKEFALVSFNDAFAQVDGWPVTNVDLLMMALVVLVTVAGLQAVGLILVVAMLIIPPVAARFWTERLGILIIVAGIIGGLSGYFGSVISALLPRKPAGAVIVLTSGAIFFISMMVAPARGVIASVIRRIRLRLRIASDHALEAAFDHQRGSNNNEVFPKEKLDELARIRAWSGWFRSVVLLQLRVTGNMELTKSGTLALTPKGRMEGRRVSRNHRLWEQYLISYADVAPNHVDWSVDQVEHVLPEELVAELELAISSQYEHLVPECGS